MKLCKGLLNQSCHLLMSCNSRNILELCTTLESVSATAFKVKDGTSPDLGGPDTHNLELHWLPVYFLVQFKVLGLALTTCADRRGMLQVPSA